MFLKDLSDFSLQGLRVFSYVASMGSVAEAAEALNLSQPAVSLQISNLEKQVSYPLFERSGRRNVLTTRGQDFYQKILPVLEKLEQIILDSKEGDAGTRPKLFVGSVEGIGEYWLLKRFSRFSDLHEGVRLFLEVADNDILQDRLVTGREVLVITPRKIEDAGIVSQALMNERLVPVGRKDRIQELDQLVSKKDERYWENVSWIGYGDALSTERWATRWLEGVGTMVDRRFKYRHTANSYAVIKTLLLDGLGVCVMPKHVVQQELDHEALVCLESKKYPGISNQMYIAWRANSLTRIHDTFKDWILEQAAQE
jgi:DNA-binding transcriptional LysR family regulator